MEDFSTTAALVNNWITYGDTCFKPLFDHCYPRLLQYAARFINDHALAEELAMNVLYKIWRHKEHIAALTDFNSYLFMMMRNETVSTLRRKKAATQPLLPEDPAYAATSADDSIGYRELLERYRLCLEQLPPRRRQAFILNRENGLSYAEIAAQLNVSVFTVQNHIAASLKYLRSQLYDYADFLPLIASLFVAMLPVC